MILHRFTVKPRHENQFLELWPEEVALRRASGFTFHRAFMETDAEPKVTWLYSHPEGAAANEELASTPAYQDLRSRMAPHVFRNVKIREVETHALTEQVDPEQTAIMRRYAIVGDWEEFLAVWRQVVVVREQYGFPCLFAVADRRENMFTWAFGFDGAWADFRAAQRPYYSDPARVALRGVFDYMADYDIHPARQLTLPLTPDAEA